MSLSSLFLGNGTFVDVLRGYVSMDQFQAGEAFNTLNYNLAAEKLSYFIAWWTPGQAFLPYSISMLGIPLWISQGIWITLFTGISLLGYFRLFQFLGFSRNTSLLSVLIIQTNQLFFWNTLLYFGGSLFEIGFFPWLILIILNLKPPYTGAKALKYFAIAIILFFFKATFLIHAGIGLAVLLFDFKKLKTKEIVWIVLTGISILAICYFGFLQFGESPSSAHDFESYDSIPNSFLMDLATPFAGIVGVFSNVAIVLQKLMPWESRANAIAYFVFPILSLSGIWILRIVYFKDENTKRLAQFTILFFTCFLYFYLTNKAISYDMRHFAPLAFVFVPFALIESRRLIKRDWIFKTGINLLLILNISLFIFQRGIFTVGMSESHGLYYSSEEVTELDDILAVGKETQCNSFVLVDNWSAQVVLKNKSVLPIFKNKGKWFLKSGMEISNPREIDFKKDLATTEDFVLFLPAGTFDLLKRMKSFESNAIITRRHYEVYYCKRLP
jgi:hypothetical protein